MVRVEVKNLGKQFGDVKAVNELSFRVDDGEFFCLLGPSGCGKTTTLRMLAGLERPDSGEIWFGDRLVNELPPSERDIAMVFQFYALYPGLTVYENLAAPLKARKMPKNEIEKAVKEAASSLRIGDVLKNTIDSVTIGERQRVALGRAIVRRPQLYLLDEPLTNLDTRLRMAMRVELVRLQRELKQTMIYVTHDQIEAITMANRIAVMNSGVLQQVATPNEVYNSPNNKFVASFIGSPSMNFVDCTFDEARSSLEFDSFRINVAHSADSIRKAASGSELTLGFRPEDVAVFPEKAPRDGIEAMVDLAELVGDKMLLHLIISKTEATAIIPRGMEPRLQKKVWIKIDKMIVFDKKTERAIA